MVNSQKLKEAPKIGGIFRFISNHMLRSILEIILSSLIGAVILFIFILGAGLLNVTSTTINGSNSDILAATYIPVLCILPFIIGILGPLILEKVRNDRKLSLKGGSTVSFLSAFIGSGTGAIILILFGVFNITPLDSLGLSFVSSFGKLAYLVVGIILVFFTSVLSTFGGFLIITLLNRADGVHGSNN